MPEVNSPITPTGLLGHNATVPGTVTPAAAQTLLGYLKADGGTAVLVDNSVQPLTHSSPGQLDLSTLAANTVEVTVSANISGNIIVPTGPGAGKERQVTVILVISGSGITIGSLVGGSVELADETVEPTIPTTNGAKTELNFIVDALNVWNYTGHRIIQSAEIADEAITNAKLAHMEAGRIKGRSDGAGTGDAEDLTAAQVRTILNVADGANNYSLPAASPTVVGGVELADASEVNPGTDATRAVTPDALAGSDYGKRSVAIEVFDGSGAITTGDAKYRFPVPDWLAGFNVTKVELVTDAPSTSGVIECKLRRGRQGTPTAAPTFVEVLTTNVTIDANEYHSKDATAGHAINGSNDDIAAGDVFAVDSVAIGSGPTARVHMIITCAKP